MHRWLSILLLVVMPLQLNWAAVAAYCAHEASPSATHFGHHAHEHQAGVSAPEVDVEARAKVSAGAALDIADCHFHACGAVVLAVSIAMPVVIAAGAPIAGQAMSLNAPVLAQPERPQWTRHA